MTELYSPSEREMAEVMRLEPEQRYVYFVRRVARWMTAWGLVDDNGFALVGSDDGSEAVALWPSKSYAHVAAINRWEGLTPHPIELDYLLDTFLRDVREGDLRVAVFPVLPGGGSIVGADVLEDSLREAPRRRT